MSDLFLYDLATGRTRRLWRDRVLESDPRFSRDGRWLLFSSDRTGIYNLYAWDLKEDRLWQVTNVVSGAYQPDVSPDGRRIVFVGYRSRGFDVAMLMTPSVIGAVFRCESDGLGVTVLNVAVMKRTVASCLIVSGAMAERAKISEIALWQ